MHGVECGFNVVLLHELEVWKQVVGGSMLFTSDSSAAGAFILLVGSLVRRASYARCSVGRRARLRVGHDGRVAGVGVWRE